jgi:hypothetical protein
MTLSTAVGRQSRKRHSQSVPAAVLVLPAGDSEACWGCGERAACVVSDLGLCCDCLDGSEPAGSDAEFVVL